MGKHIKKNYSPAPWKVIHGWDKNGEGTYFPSVLLTAPTKQGDFTIAPQIIINESHDQTKESIMANAYLIAAAPDMLEVLQYIKDDADHKFDDGIVKKGGTIYKMISEAIAKANGENI